MGERRTLPVQNEPVIERGYEKGKQQISTQPQVSVLKNAQKEPEEGTCLAKCKASPKSGKIKSIISWKKNRLCYDKVSCVVRRHFSFKEPRANAFIFFDRSLLRKWQNDSSFRLHPNDRSCSITSPLPLSQLLPLSPSFTHALLEHRFPSCVKGNDTDQGSWPSPINRNWLQTRQEIQARLYWGPCCSRGEWEQVTGSLACSFPGRGGRSGSLYVVRVTVWSVQRGTRGLLLTL